MYFLMVTASTVGYGDFSPSSTMEVVVNSTTGETEEVFRQAVTGSRIFTIFMIFFGICVVFAQLSAIISEIFLPVFHCVTAVIERVFPQEAIDIDGDGTADFKVPRHPLIYYSKNLFGPVVIIISFQLFFAAIFTTLEDMDFGTAMYHCLVTATTVGYGDVSINTDGGKMWAFIQIIVSVSLLAAVIGDIGELSEARAAALHKMELLGGTRDFEMMKSLDTDGDGVDKFEFVFGMLAKLGMVSEDDVEPFVKLFEEMDADNSGKLTPEDFDQLAQTQERDGRSATLATVQEALARSTSLAGGPRKSQRTSGRDSGRAPPRSPAVSIEVPALRAAVSDHL